MMLFLVMIKWKVMGFVEGGLRNIQVDLGFMGPKFTWTNKRDLLGLIQGRLDRV